MAARLLMVARVALLLLAFRQFPIKSVIAFQNVTAVDTDIVSIEGEVEVKAEGEIEVDVEGATIQFVEGNLAATGLDEPRLQQQRELEYIDEGDVGTNVDTDYKEDLLNDINIKEENDEVKQREKQKDACDNYTEMSDPSAVSDDINLDLGAVTGGIESVPKEAINSSMTADEGVNNSDEFEVELEPTLVLGIEGIELLKEGIDVPNVSHNDVILTGAVETSAFTGADDDAAAGSSGNEVGIVSGERVTDANAEALGDADDGGDGDEGTGDGDGGGNSGGGGGDSGAVDPASYDAADDESGAVAVSDDIDSDDGYEQRVEKAKGSEYHERRQQQYDDVEDNDVWDNAGGNRMEHLHGDQLAGGKHSKEGAKGAHEEINGKKQDQDEDGETVREGESVFTLEEHKDEGEKKEKMEPKNGIHKVPRKNIRQGEAMKIDDAARNEPPLKGIEETVLVTFGVAEDRTADGSSSGGNGGGSGSGSGGGGGGGGSRNISSEGSRQGALKKRVAEMERAVNSEMERIREASLHQHLREQELDDVDKSYLELWADQSKAFILTHMTPTTDKECDFSWKRGRCEPKCTCHLDPKFGDYWPSRMCRLVPIWQRDPACPLRPDPSDVDITERVSKTLQSIGKKSVELYQKQIAYPTDEICRFSFRRRRCEPADVCQWTYKRGDLTPHASCRLRIWSLLEGRKEEGIGEGSVEVLKQQQRQHQQQRQEEEDEEQPS